TTGMTPVLAACETGNKEIFLKLVELGVNVHAATAKGETALMLACAGKELRSEEAVTLQVHVDSKGETSIACTNCVKETPREDIVDTLLRLWVNPKAVSSDGSTALHAALANGLSSIALKLIAHKV